MAHSGADGPRDALFARGVRRAREVVSIAAWITSQSASPRIGSPPEHTTVPASNREVVDGRREEHAHGTDGAGEREPRGREGGVELLRASLPHLREHHGEGVSVPALEGEQVERHLSPSKRAGVVGEHLRRRARGVHVAQDLVLRPKGSSSVGQKSDHSAYAAMSPSSPPK